MHIPKESNFALQNGMQKSDRRLALKQGFCSTERDVEIRPLSFIA